MVSPDKITDAELTGALPDVETDVTVAGLTATVTITRDGLGIPHVSASTPADAFFGQGFVTAQDRLWHMDYDRMKAYGRWAEFAGPPGVPSDLLMRRMQVQAAVIRDYQELGDAATEMLDVYAAGVNAFIRSTKNLPLEYGLVDEILESRDLGKEESAS